MLISQGVKDYLRRQVAQKGSIEEWHKEATLQMLVATLEERTFPEPDQVSMNFKNWNGLGINLDLTKVGNVWCLAGEEAPTVVPL